MRILELFATIEQKSLYAVERNKSGWPQSVFTALLENGKMKDCHEYKFWKKHERQSIWRSILCTDRNMQLQTAGAA